ncbi:MAG: TetR/AcrR family transcriptional regulator [Sinobacteraceae bacterium]|nr:TetR/AcrR family transcriptional regulator [Nevskiaceae bacterium]
MPNSPRPPPATRKQRPQGPSRAAPLGRDAWLRVARQTLIREGIRGIEIGKLARKLRATRGGFYWFFNARQQLLDELLADWEQTNSATFKAILEGAESNWAGRMDRLARMFIDEEGFSPAYDSAVRDWARVSRKVASTVRRVDEQRIALLARAFRGMDHADDEAFVRARIFYFHQVGYYAMDVRESREDRLRLLPLYTKALMGR